MNYLTNIVQGLMRLKTEAEVHKFFEELMTPSEIAALSKRWCILKMLSERKSQRDIAKELGVSLCKVTRGSKILKKDGNVISKIII